MIIVDVNWIAVIIATVASIALGFAWYSQKLFGKAWLAEMNLTEAQISNNEGMNKTYALLTLGSLVMAYVLAHVVVITNSTTLADGVRTGFWMWLGFVVPVMMASVLWEQKSWRLFGINAGYQLVNLALMGTILALWY